MNLSYAYMGMCICMHVHMCMHVSICLSGCQAQTRLSNFASPNQFLLSTAP